MEPLNQNENNQPGLAIQDLRVAADIINICTQRGAFRANELSSVGLLYDRLTAFLTANDASTEPQPTSGTDAAQE